MYEVEHVKAEIEHPEPIIVGFFILQYAKLGMLVLYYNYFKQYCDETKFKDFEMDVASAKNDITDCIRQNKLSEWSAIRKEDCGDKFEADSLRNFFPRTCCSTHSQLDEPEPGVFKEEFRATEMICLCSKT